MRRGHVERVRSGAIARQLCQDICVTPFGMRFSFQHQHSGAFAHHQPIPIFVKRFGRHRIIIVAARHGAHPIERGDAYRADRHFCCAG